MALGVNDVGFERGATTLALSLCKPQVVSRYQLGSTERMVLQLALLTAAEVVLLKTLIGENQRITATGLTGVPVVVEWYSATDGSGPVTVKIVTGAATTISCAFTDGWVVESLTGPYPEGAPSTITYYRATVPLILL